MYSYTEPREAVLEYTGWLLSGSNDWQPVNVAEGRRHGKTIIVRVDGYDGGNYGFRVRGYVAARRRASR